MFLFGLIGNGFPFFRLEHLRVYGVLQRIAICYLVVALFYLWDRRIWTKIAALVACLVGLLDTCFAGFRYRAPACRAATFPSSTQTQNIVNWLDQRLFPYHLYEDWTTHNLRDPEGLLSNIPAIGTVLLGLLTGLWLRKQNTIKTKTLGLAAGAVSCLAAGYLWSLSFPLNKKMWTSSYVLVAAGWSLAVSTLVYFAVELLGWGKAARQGFSSGPGSSSAPTPSSLICSVSCSPALYGEHSLSPPAESKPISPPGSSPTPSHIFLDPGWAAFSFSVTYLAVCFVPIWLLYRKKIFIRI